MQTVAVLRCNKDYPHQHNDEPSERLRDCEGPADALGRGVPAAQLRSPPQQAWRVVRRIALRFTSRALEGLRHQDKIAAVAARSHMVAQFRTAALGPVANL